MVYFASFGTLYHSTVHQSLALLRCNKYMLCDDPTYPGKLYCILTLSFPPQSVRQLIDLVLLQSKPQALVYNILPSTTAVFGYAIGSRKLLANEQFFVGAQTVVSLLQTTQTKQGVSFIADNKVCTRTNTTTIV